MIVFCRRGMRSMGSCRERSPRSIKSASDARAIASRFTSPLRVSIFEITKAFSGQTARISATSEARFAKDKATWQIPIWAPIFIAARSFSVSTGKGMSRSTLTALFWPILPPFKTRSAILSFSMLITCTSTELKSMLIKSPSINSSKTHLG